MNDTNMIIGNYHIISPIAVGAFGRVYLARHSVLENRQVALKLMHTLPFSSEDEHKQFLQEARILEKLKHPYILPILDVGVHEGVPYIVSEYAPGDSLRKRLHRRDTQPISLEEAQNILSQIGQALQYVHEQNIIHRDIKPENILFNDRGHALLADFGIATALATASMKTTASAGTPRYMPPEQFKGKVSRESDQYALACVAYELFTGRPPFDGTDGVSLMYQHLHVAPEPLRQYNPEIPSEIEQIVLKALSKKRDERYKSVRAFLAALQNTEITLRVRPVPISASVPTLKIAEPHSSFSTIPIASEKEQDQSSSPLPKEAIQLSSLIGEDSSAAISSSPSERKVISLSVPSPNQEKDLLSAPERRSPKIQFPLLPKILSSHWLITLSSVTLVVLVAGFLLSTQLTSFANTKISKGVTPLSSHPTSTSIPSSTQTAQPVAVQPTKKLLPSLTPTQPGNASHSASGLPPGPGSIPQATPTPTPRVLSAPAATATAVPVPTPTPIPPTSTPTPTPHSINYYVCGDQVNLVNQSAWNTVQSGSVVSTKSYSGPVNSYMGPYGDPNNSPGNCSGRYQWAWNQNQVEADWTWSNASLPNGTCGVRVHIPSWYAGAPDAHYALTVSADSGSSNYTFDTQNQNQVSTTWINLLINKQTASIPMPSSTSNVYTLTLSLFNGGTTNWYLGADAIEFVCTAQ